MTSVGLKSPKSLPSVPALQEEAKEEEPMEAECDGKAGSEQDVADTACVDPILPDMEVVTDNGTISTVTSEGKSPPQCSLQQEVDVGGSQGTRRVFVCLLRHLKNLLIEQN